MPPIEQFAEFASNHPWLSMGLVASVLVLIFSELQRKARSVTDISAIDAVRLMNDDAAVIDVRSVERFQAGHLVNSKNLPLEQLEPGSDKVKSLVDKPLIVVCDTGMNSAKAVATLRKAGYDKTFSLKGGIAGWQQDNLPLIAKRKGTRNKQAAKS